MARILTVDDNPTMAEMLSMALEGEGHRTLVALGSWQALEVIASARADVVLLDLMMPDIDGFETLHRLRATPHGREHVYRERGRYAYLPDPSIRCRRR